MNINDYKSNVEYYSRIFPSTFNRAKGCFIYDTMGKAYLDFLSGAGALNYGHNNDEIKKDLLEYLQNDGILQGLDMDTTARNNFIKKFSDIILVPKNLNYKIMFCAPTGTNGIEAALKLARKYTKRNGIIAFSGAFHGMTLGSLSVTGNITKRHAAGITLNDVTFIPYYDNNFKDFDGIDFLERMITDDHSGLDLPAAIIVETTQAEGGVCSASNEWLKKLRLFCDRYQILLICDDIQVGCGRTGHFFSFERAGIIPDIVVLSKSLSGLGLPMTIMLFKAQLDVWQSAEHNGTFRGNQLAFITAAAALDFYKNNELMENVKDISNYSKSFITEKICSISPQLKYRGIGLLQGIDCSLLCSEFAKKVQTRCFEKGLILETCGRGSNVIKIMPPLIIDRKTMQIGLDIIKSAIIDMLG